MQQDFAMTDEFNVLDYESAMATNMFYVEKELGVYIDDDYPLVKLNSQLRELNEYSKREKAEMDKAKRK